MSVGVCYISMYIRMYNIYYNIIPIQPVHIIGALSFYNIGIGIVYLTLSYFDRPTGILTIYNNNNTCVCNILLLYKCDFVRNKKGKKKKPPIILIQRRRIVAVFFPLMCRTIELSSGRSRYLNRCGWHNDNKRAAP